MTKNNPDFSFNWAIFPYPGFENISCRWLWFPDFDREPQGIHPQERSVLRSGWQAYTTSGSLLFFLIVLNENLKCMNQRERRGGKFEMKRSNEVRVTASIWNKLFTVGCCRNNAPLATTGPSSKKHSTGNVFLWSRLFRFCKYAHRGFSFFTNIFGLVIYNLKEGNNTIENEFVDFIISKKKKSLFVCIL